MDGEQMGQNQVFQITEMKQEEKIIVFGVGGGGGNALNHIIESGVQGVDFVAANTDTKALNLNKAPSKIRLGPKLTHGLGAGANPQVGMDSAKESMEEIKEYIKGADMLFVTAGMGGGTGTGAAPVIAAAAREMNILVVAVVTLPFGFEMPKRFQTAQEGISRLKENVDALLIVENDKLLELADDRLRLVDAYGMVDEVLRQAVQGVTDLIVKPGFINLDFSDVKTVMSNAGSAIMGIGVGEGDNRAEQAARAAIKSPLMSVPLEGAKGILFNVTTGDDVTLVEMQQAAEVIRATAAPTADVIWGHVIDEEMKDSIRITLIATGFPEVSIRQPAPGRQVVDKTKRQPTPVSVAPPTPGRVISTVYPRKREGTGFEESRLQSPGEENTDIFHGVPKMACDEPAYYRKRQREN